MIYPYQFDEHVKYYWAEMYARADAKYFAMIAG
jgi:hypothetical protein